MRLTWVPLLMLHTCKSSPKHSRYALSNTTLRAQRSSPEHHNSKRVHWHSEAEERVIGWRPDVSSASSSPVRVGKRG